MDRFADSYARGETPVPCIALQPAVKFRDLLGHRPRARRRGAGDRPLCAPLRARRPRAAPRRRSGARPELFPVRDDREQLDFLRFPLGGLPKSETRALAERFGCRSPTSPTARTSASCPTATMPRWCEKLRPEAVEPRRHRRHGRPRPRPSRRHRPLHRRPAPRPGARRRGRRPLYVVRLEPRDAPRHGRPARALGRSEIALYDLNWIGALPGGTDRPCRCGCAPARRCVPPRSSARPGRGRALRPARDGRLARPGLRGLRRRQWQPRAGWRLHKALRG